MNLSQAGDTADILAMHRAIEISGPPFQRVCNDPNARQFLGPSRANLLKSSLGLKIFGWLTDKLFPGVNGAVIARTRFIDDVVTAGLSRGLEQLVILGAGYDSRAYRLPGIEGRVKVFEVDHPAIQQDKLEKLRLIFERIPEHVVYVPIDLTKDRLDEPLFESGYDPRKRTLFILEGLLMHLTRPQVCALLDFVPTNAGPESAMVFDILPASIVDGTIQAREGRAMYRRARRRGAPLAFGLNEDDLEDFLVERNFLRIRQANAFDCKADYFCGSQMDCQVSAIFTFVHAVVRPAAGPLHMQRPCLRLIRNDTYVKHPPARMTTHRSRVTLWLAQ